MKKLMIIAAVVIVLAIGGYAFTYQAPKPVKTSSQNTTATATTQDQKPATSVNNTVFSTKLDSNIGKYLATTSGKPLYTYKDDKPGVSNCTVSCLSTWPAYQATSTSTAPLPADVTVIRRTDNNQMQYAYKGSPLYTFVGDKDGQVTGDGISKFVVAKP